MSRKDQLVAPAPVVVFPTQQAADRIIAGMKAAYDQAAKFARERGTLGIQKGEEIRQLQKEINERQAWLVQKEGEKDLLEAESRDARDVAKGYADLLAAAGIHLPPPNGELSLDPDTRIRNIEAAHDEQDAAEGVRRS
ncbi:hypothetical protein ACFXJ8_26290 [Nonomuraea sp. NPDC059194]|uniref:hypothetical protein n=1 Tax=Nonomuraea sp. NPDC059194 TaxID=3346764 RepID=UPI0036B03882